MKRLRKRRKTKLQRKAELRWLFFVDVGLWRVEETEEVSPRFFFLLYVCVRMCLWLLGMPSIRWLCQCVSHQIAVSVSVCAVVYLCVCHQCLCAYYAVYVWIRMIAGIMIPEMFAGMRCLKLVIFHTNLLMTIARVSQILEIVCTKLRWIFQNSQNLWTKKR